MEKKSKIDLLALAVTAFGMLLLLANSIKSIFTVKQRWGTVKEKRLIEKAYTINDDAMSLCPQYGVMVCHVVVIVDDSGEEEYYDIDQELYKIVVTGRKIKFKCQLGRIIEIFAENDEEEVAFCDNAQHA
jgi:phosphoribosyl-dephospho-CoA transferase